MSLDQGREAWCVCHGEDGNEEDGSARFGYKLLDTRLLGLPNIDSKRKTNREVGQWEERLASPTPSLPRQTPSFILVFSEKMVFVLLVAPGIRQETSCDMCYGRSVAGPRGQPHPPSLLPCTSTEKEVKGTRKLSFEPLVFTTVRLTY